MIDTTGNPYCVMNDTTRETFLKGVRWELKTFRGRTLLYETAHSPKGCVPVTVPPIALNRIALVCPHTCACNAVLRAPPFKAPSKAHFLIPFKGLIPLIFIKNGWSIYRRRKLPYIFLSHFIPFYYHRQTHPFPTSLPLHGTRPGAPSTPSLLILCKPLLS